MSRSSRGSDLQGLPQMVATKEAPSGTWVLLVGPPRDSNDLKASVSGFLRVLFRVLTLETSNFFKRQLEWVRKRNNEGTPVR